MSDEKANRIIKMADEEKGKATNMLNLYQEFADLGYPVENQITTKRTYGEDKSLVVRDPTAIFALDRATSGFIGAWIPRERYFFGIKIKNRQVAEIDTVKRWAAEATQIAHEEIFESNYMTQLHNTIKSAIGFGTGNSYCEWNSKTLSLNFKDWHVSYYTFKQDARGIVDTMILQYEMTARQMADKWDNPGKDVLKDCEKLETESKVYSVIHVVRPRIRHNYKLMDKMNMPFESVFVNVKEKKIISEGGFERFPFAVARWEQASCEKWGRGRGLAMLSFIKELQQMRKDYMECANRHNHSPYEVVSNNVEGEVNLKPDGRTNVLERNSINPINPAINGNFPVTVEALNDQRQIIKDGFYNDIFSQFANLKGDRRVQLELQLRNEETMAQLISPVARMESEFFTPQISHAILLLIENGRIPQPPPELSNQSFGIEYMGRLAMAMKDMQARGFERAMGVVGNMAAIFPNVTDEINVDRAMPDILLNYGMKVEHLNTPTEKEAIRAERAKRLAQQEAMQMAQAVAPAYKEATKAPEEGSPAGALLEGVGA